MPGKLKSIHKTLKKFSNLRNLFFAKLNQLFDFFLKILNHTPAKQFWYKLVVTLAVFLFSFFLIQRNNGFFSGDMGVIGSITHDYQRGVFHSWFFYGQNYYGNLENFFLAFLTLFTGISVKSLYFWEHFFYFVSVFLLLISLPKMKLWQIFLYPLIFFFAIRFYRYTYFPQGFAFVTLIVVSFYFFLEKFYQNKVKNISLLGFFIGLFASLSIWHYPLYIIILPIFLAIYSYNLYLKKINFKIQHLLSLVSGLIIGIIPFILGSLEKDFANLSQFQSSGENTLVKIYNSTLHYGRDFFYYFLKTDGLNDDSTLKEILLNLLDLRNLWGLSILFVFVLMFLYSFKYWQKNLVLYAFIFSILFLMIYRGIPDNSNSMFGTLRYSLQFYTLSYFLVLKTITQVLNSVDFTKNFKPNLDFVYSALGIYLLLSLSLFIPSNIGNQYLHAHRGRQFYEDILDRIIQEEVRYVYCQDYFQACGALVFLAKNKDIYIHIIDAPNRGMTRNPNVTDEVDNAARRGDRVLSLIMKNNLSENDEVIEVYRGGMYHLVEGVFEKRNID